MPIRYAALCYRLFGFGIKSLGKTCMGPFLDDNAIKSLFGGYQGANLKKVSISDAGSPLAGWQGGGGIRGPKCPN